MMGGRLSKFQERIKNIRLTKGKKKKFQKENEEFILKKVEEIKKKIKEDGTVYRKRIPRGVLEEDCFSESIPFSLDTKGRKKEVKVDFKYEDEMLIKQEENSFQDSEENNSLDDKIQSKVREIEKRAPKIIKKRVVCSGDCVEKSNQDIKKQDNKNEDTQLKELSSAIIYKIKNNFLNYLDEVDVLAGEIYLIHDNLYNEIDLSKVYSLKKKINELIDKVNAIMEQYNLYKKNLYLDEVIGIEDSSIALDMMAYRDLLASEDKRKFVKEYQALEEFKLLYSHLCLVKEETLKLMNQQQEKEKMYFEKDKKYLEIQKSLAIENDVLLKCNEDIMRQNEYFQELNSKIDFIEKEEYLTYQLKGMDKLLGNGLKYMGLMLLSPFSGLIPSIGYQALLTKRMVQGAYQGLHYEKKLHIHYYATDYEKEILSKLSDINYTTNLLNDTLDNVQKLKEDFLMQYQPNIPLYEDFLKKINIMEEKLIHQQNRVDIISKRLKKNQERNQQKMVRVRTLNQND